MSSYRYNAGHTGGSVGTRRRIALPARQISVVSTTQDLIDLDELEFPVEAHELQDEVIRRSTLARDRRRAEQMAAENSRPFLPHVLSVEPMDRKKAA